MKGPEDRGLEVEEDDSLEGATVRNDKPTNNRTNHWKCGRNGHFSYITVPLTKSFSLKQVLHSLVTVKFLLESAPSLSPVSLPSLKSSLALAWPHGSHDGSLVSRLLSPVCTHTPHYHLKKQSNRMNPLFKSFYWIPITHKTVRTPCMPCNTPTLRTQPNSPASAPATPEPHFPGPASSHRATCSFRNIPRPFTPVSLRCSFARRGYYFLTSLPASPSKLSSVSVSALTFASSTTNTPSSVLPWRLLDICSSPEYCNALFPV